jgi:chromosome segregation ATPase
VRLEAISRLEADLAAVRSDLDPERQARHQAERDAAVLSAQLEAVTARAAKAETDLAEAATAHSTVANLNGKLEALQTQLTQQAKALDTARQDARKASETAAELRGKHGRRSE